MRRASVIFVAVALLCGGCSTGGNEMPQKTSDVEPETEFRRLGKARVEIAQQAKSREDWQRLWKEPERPYPFAFGTCWKQCAEYAVLDYEAEVGFWIDGMGFSTNAFGATYAMFTGPDKDFFFSVVPAPQGSRGTPPETFRLQFMIRDIEKVSKNLEKRGILFEAKPAPCEDGSPLWKASFRTPHGIPVDLWCLMEEVAPATSKEPSAR